MLKKILPRLRSRLILRSKSTTWRDWQDPPTISEILDYYFEQGFWLIKLIRETKSPPEKDYMSKPRPTKQEVMNWLAEGFSIGVMNGSVSGNSVVTDVDDPKLNEKVYPEKDWQKKTLVICSSDFGKKGKKLHYYFKTRTPVRTKHGLRHSGVNIDVQGEGAYTVLPPSINPKTGNPYTFERIPPPSIMKWEGDFYEDFIKRLVDNVNYEPEPETIKVNELFLPRDKGDRHFWLIRIITWLVQCKTEKKTAWETVQRWNEDNNPPIDLSELEYQFNDVWDDPLTLVHFDSRPTEYFSAEALEEAEKALQENPLDAILEAVHQLHTGDDELIKGNYISTFSPKISKVSINIWTIGTSQMGKSHMLYCILRTTQPKDFYEVFTSASPKSLFYFAKKYGDNVFDGLIIFIDEVEASEETLPVLRSLTGQTDITPRHLSVNDSEVMDLKITGKRVVWFTSVESLGGDQLRNRFLFENPDESINQDINIGSLQEQRDYYDVDIDQSKIEKAKAITSLIVKNTKDLKVVFPYGWTWSLTRYRYLFPVFVSMIKICTKIHFMKRKRDENNNLISSSEDFEIVKKIWQAMEKEILYRVNRKCQMVLDALPEEQKDAISVTALATKLNFSTNWVRKQLDVLKECNLVNAEKNAQHMWTYWEADIPTISDIQLRKEKGIVFTNREKVAKNQFSEASAENKIFPDDVENRFFATPPNGPKLTFEKPIEEPVDRGEEKEMEG